MITKEEFEKLIDKKLIEEEGKLVYDGNLGLYFRTDITELPDNLKVLGYLTIKKSGVTKLPKGLEVGCFLEISETDIEELPEDTMLGGSLYVNDMNKPFSFPNMVKVNGYFNCKNTIIKRMPEELYTEYDCNFSGCTFDKLPNVMENGFGLYLNDTAIAELPEGLKEVYGNFEISNTKLTKLNDNLVVYNSIFLCNTLIEELPKGLIVGSWLNLCNTKLKDYSNLHKFSPRFIVDEKKYKEIKDSLIKHEISYDDGDVIFVTFEPNYKGAYLFENKNGKYIDVDGIFGKIVEQKGNVYHIRLRNHKYITYLVTDGEGHWAHGGNLEGAKDDLLYKITDRNKSDYENLTLESELSFEDAIMCYRVVTGACSFGTRDFIKNRLGNNKKEVYTINEIIELTEGEYGNTTFKNFFYRD